MADELDTSLEDIQNADTNGLLESDEDKPYLGTWKTREEADRGLAEMQKAMAKFQSEKDKALAEKERLEKDFFAKLAGGVNGPAPTQPTIDVNKIKEQIAERIDADGGKAVAEIIYDLTADLERLAEEKSTKKTRELEDQLKAMRDELLYMKPENAIVKEKVEELAEEFPNLSRSDLMKMAKKLMPSVTQPNRPQIPGNTGYTMGSATPSTGGLRAEDIAYIERMSGGRKLSKAELARLVKGGK